MAAMISGSELAVIEHRGHMAPMERLEDVTSAMAAWFVALTN
jgi:hypothetical protein